MQFEMEYRIAYIYDQAEQRIKQKYALMGIKSCEDILKINH